MSILKKVSKVVCASIVILGVSFSTANAAEDVVNTQKNEVTQNNYTNAIVKKIDLENKKITLKHEDIKNLGMPGMTMIFKSKVTDSNKLNTLKIGDNVKAYLDQDSDGLIVRDIIKE